MNRVEIADAYGVRNECTPTFYERFAEASLHEAQAFVDVVREDRIPPLTLRDATEATRIGIAVTESLRTKRSVELWCGVPEIRNTMSTSFRRAREAGVSRNPLVTFLAIQASTTPLDSRLRGNDDGEICCELATQYTLA